jgi:hypothetical protein
MQLRAVAMLVSGRLPPLSAAAVVLPHLTSSEDPMTSPILNPIRRTQLTTAAVLLLAGTFAAGLLTDRTWAAPVPKGETPLRGGVFVLDNCDPADTGKARYGDNLSYYDSTGKLVFRVTGFNNSGALGCQHRVAADSDRKCVWVCEDAGRRVRKFDRAGKELLTIPFKDVSPHALSVDPASGNVWVLVTERTIYGDRTVVYDTDGKELVTHALRGHDIVYDPAVKAFWLAGRNLFKVPAEKVKEAVGPGDVVGSLGITDYCAMSVAVAPKTGLVWVAFRATGSGPGGLPEGRDDLRAFDPDAKLAATIPVALKGEKRAIPFHVSADPTGGEVWLTALRQDLLRFTAEGKSDGQLGLKAVAAVPDLLGGAWVATEEEVLRVDKAGATKLRVKHAGPSNMAWVTLD